MKDLENLELHSNKNAPLRRDIVGANHATSGIWRRMSQTYKAFQVVFEVKNYREVGPDEFAQARAYMGGLFATAPGWCRALVPEASER